MGWGRPAWSGSGASTRSSIFVHIPPTAAPPSARPSTRPSARSRTRSPTPARPLTQPLSLLAYCPKSSAHHPPRLLSSSVSLSTGQTLTLRKKCATGWREIRAKKVRANVVAPRSSPLRRPPPTSFALPPQRYSAHVNTSHYLARLAPRRRAGGKRVKQCNKNRERHEGGKKTRDEGEGKKRGRGENARKG